MSLTATTTDIVQKLWSLCDVLRDDGITYHQYVTELTYLLFLKMAEETERESNLPEGYRWNDLAERDGLGQLEYYRGMLLHLGTEAKSDRVKAIFAGANSSLTVPRNLKTLTESIDALDWFSAKSEGLGDLYEGLLEKNANEKKSGAGQYFTPRPLIDCMVELMNPQPGEIIQDPAAGTGGFLVAADHYIKQKTDDLFDLSEDQQRFNPSWPKPSAANSSPRTPTTSQPPRSWSASSPNRKPLRRNDSSCQRLPRRIHRSLDVQGASRKFDCARNSRRPDFEERSGLRAVSTAEVRATPKSGMQAGFVPLNGYPHGLTQDPNDEPASALLERIRSSNGEPARR